MAGIGFDLRRLAHHGTLLSAAAAYGYAALIVAGPWLFTVLCLAGIYLYSRGTVDAAEITTFQVVVTWNFSLSLVLSGAVVLTATRYLADCIHQKAHRRAPGLMLSALALVYVLGMVVALPLYGRVLDLTVAARFAAVVNFLLVSGIWVVTLFLSALKDYRRITLIFATGMAVAFTAGALAAEPWGAAGMLGGFSLGLLLIHFTIAGRVFAEYTGAAQWPEGFATAFRNYWELALGGLLFAAAIWVDKWVMWLAPERELIAGGLAFNRYYDTAMFLACLTAIPAMAMFTVTGETGLFERLRGFFRDIHAHAPYPRIAADQRGIIRHVAATFRNTIMVQAAVSALAIFLAPQVIAWAGGSYMHLGMFRLGVLGAMFFTLTLLVSIILAYIDHRRAVLLLQALFLALNGALTAVSLRLGFTWYGTGFFAASLITFVAGYAVLTRALRDLPYLVFIRNNPSIQ